MKFGERLLEWLVRAQTRRPFLFLAVALLTGAISLAFARTLELRTNFGELLPQGKESVIVADRVSARIVSASTLTIVAEGSDKLALEHFVDALAPAVRALGPDTVGNVDAGVRASRAFFDQHKLLYAPLADIEKAHDELLERYGREVARAQGTLLDDDEPTATDANGGGEKTLRARFEEHKESPLDRYPDGYYLDDKAEPKLIAVLVRTPVSSGDIDAARAFKARIEKVIAEVDPKKFDPAMRVEFTGDFITSGEEYDAIKRDLTQVGIAGVALVLGVVLIFFTRIRTLAAMGLTIAVGVLWSFGFAALTIGHLNSSTGFLVSILVGNGINFGIVYMARYLEARRTDELEQSIRIAHRETWVGTASAAGAAMVSYGSLAVTDFRGFKHFGVIGGAGMALTWIATYLFLPAMLAAFERIAPIRSDTGIRAKMRAAYGRPFAWITMRFPRGVAIVSLLIGAAALVISLRYVKNDPMEYDLWNVRSEEPEYQSGARRLSDAVDRIVGPQGQEGVAILVDRIEQVAPLTKALEARRDKAPEGQKPFDRVVSIFDLLPSDQERKIELLKEVQDRARRAHSHHMLTEDDWTVAEHELSPQALKPIAIADLPEQVARAFIEKDGGRGRLVYILPSEGRSVWDAHYLVEWADAFRSTTLPDGSVVKGSGRSVIFADLVISVIEDAPKAIVVSLLGVVAVIVLAFRRNAGIVLLSVGIGMATMVAFMALMGMKLNFLNFVAIPISIGVGADYAVNVMGRIQIVGRDDIRRAVIETGGAVVLCSCTTTLGYLALTLSVNLAIRSFGIAAAAGEIACLLSAVLALPAIYMLRKKPPAESASR